MARGKWVMVLHEDDALYPWYLECVLPHLCSGCVAVCMMTSRGLDCPGPERPAAPDVPAYRLSAAVLP